MGSDPGPDPKPGSDPDPDPDPKPGSDPVPNPRQVACKLTSARPLKSVAVSPCPAAEGARWLAAAAFDGSIELWDVARPAASAEARALGPK